MFCATTCFPGDIWNAKLSWRKTGFARHLCFRQVATGGALTIRDALLSQSGCIWYTCISGHMGSVLGVGDPRVTATSPLSLALDQTPSTADISTTDTTLDSKDTRLFHPDVNRNAIMFYSTAWEKALFCENTSSTQSIQGLKVNAMLPHSLHPCLFPTYKQMIQK